MKKGLLENKKMHKPDYIYLVSFLIIVFVGLIILTSATGISAYDKFDGNKYYFLINQLIKGIIPGTFIFIAIYFLSKKTWFVKLLKILTPIFYIITFFFMVLVLIIGAEYGGSRSWLNIGFISFQPSELLKFVTILYFALFFTKNDYKEDKSLLLAPIIIMLIGGLLILLQRDLGTFMIYAFICMSILLLIGIKYRYILGTFLCSFLFLLLIIKIGILGAIIGENRMMRIYVWLDPIKYENTNSAYQLQQAKIAIGSGGVFGKGIGNSIQKFLYLPEVSSDSIFAIASEEFGFIFISIFLLVYLVFILRGFYIAKRMDNEYIKYIIAGSTSFIAFQYFVNISTMTGILPLTGVPMPFVSYGNSLMIVMITSSALTFGFSRYTKEDTINNKK